MLMTEQHHYVYLFLFPYVIIVYCPDIDKNKRTNEGKYLYVEMKIQALIPELTCFRTEHQNTVTTAKVVASKFPYIKQYIKR